MFLLVRIESRLRPVLWVPQYQHKVKSRGRSLPRKIAPKNAPIYVSAYLRLKALLKNYGEIRKNLIRNEGQKSLGRLKMILKLDWLGLYRLSHLINFLDKVNETVAPAKSREEEKTGFTSVACMGLFGYSNSISLTGLFGLSNS
jgi:hypothetical protein